MHRSWTYRNTVLLLCTLAFFVTFTARVAISPLVPFITEDFAISNTVIGISLSGMWIAYGLSQYPSGILASHVGEKYVILLSVGGCGVLSLITAISPILALFCLAIVGIGAAAGLHYTVASTLLSQTFDDIGTAIGFHSLGGSAAGLTAPVIAAWIGVEFGWRYAIASVAILAIPVFLLFLWRIKPVEPKNGSVGTEEKLSASIFYSYLVQPHIAFPASIAITAMFVSNGIISFLPTFLVVYHNYTPTMASIIFAIYFFVRGGAQIGAGALSDSYNRDITVTGCLLVGICGILLYLINSGIGLILIATLGIGIGSSFFAALEPKVLDNLPEDNQNIGFGVFRTIYVVGGSTGSIGVGAVSDIFGWKVTFVFLAGLYCTSIGLVVLSRI